MSPRLLTPLPRYRLAKAEASRGRVLLYKLQDTVPWWRQVEYMVKRHHSIIFLLLPLLPLLLFTASLYLLQSYLPLGLFFALLTLFSGAYSALSFSFLLELTREGIRLSDSCATSCYRRVDPLFLPRDASKAFSELLLGERLWSSRWQDGNLYWEAASPTLDLRLTPLVQQWEKQETLRQERLLAEGEIAHRRYLTEREQALSPYAPAIGEGIEKASIPGRYPS